MYIICYYAGQERKRKILKPGAVPSIFAWSKPETPAVASRRDRAKRRKLFTENHDTEQQAHPFEDVDFVQSCEVKFIGFIIDLGSVPDFPSVLCQNRVMR